MFFGSDNQAGASSRILEALVKANDGFTPGYGEDQWTQQAVQAICELFECDAEVYFVGTGTAANCLALAGVVQPWQTILCHGGAHIYMDESTAPELFTSGSRLQPISQGQGKISADQLDQYMTGDAYHPPHNPLPGALSITQVSEAGLVYSIEELTELCTVAKRHHLPVHMDGARFANAVAALDCSPADITWRAGIDVLTLGATKCGALCAEAVIFFNKELAAGFEHRRKRTGHLLSKGRVYGVQFSAWLQDNHWLDLARHANHQASMLAEELLSYEQIESAWPVQANELFMIMPGALVSFLTESGAVFYEWYPDQIAPECHLSKDEKVVRMVTSFCTRDEHREEFCKLVKQYFESPVQ
ncbi:threonine aldolase family protein [Gynuella sp.]|uniref:threonine aldolase family protein n=1 Tax=Gynuella sp. TaxID=2969146 RepID=UPI003D126381